MKTSVCLFLFILTLFTLPSWCQSKNQYTEISYLKLTDTVLVNGIDTMVSHLEKQSSEFRKYGYITLSITEYAKGDTLIMCHAVPCLTYLRDYSKDWEYPDFYSFTKKRLVVIKTTSLSKFTQPIFSAKTKKHIQQIVNSQLENIDNKVFYDIRGKKVLGKNYDQNTYFIDTGISVCLLKDKTIIINKSY